jgi:hypothetical protein
VIRRNATDAPTFAASVAVLMCIRGSLVVLGLGRTVRVLSHLSSRRISKPINSAEAEATGVVRAVTVAAAFVPGRHRCLEQALTVYWFLRHRGVPVAVRIGVQPYGFVAHAWVEHNGRPIGETDAKLDGIVPFPNALI